MEGVQIGRDLGVEHYVGDINNYFFFNLFSSSVALYQTSYAFTPPFNIRIKVSCKTLVAGLTDKYHPNKKAL